MAREFACPGYRATNASHLVVLSAQAAGHSTLNSPRLLSKCLVLSFTPTVCLSAVQGKFAEAEGMFERSLAIHKKAVGSNHPVVAISLNNWAELFQEQVSYIIV